MLVKRNEEDVCLARDAYNNIVNILVIERLIRLMTVGMRRTYGFDRMPYLVSRYKGTGCSFYIIEIHNLPGINPPEKHLLRQSTGYNSTQPMLSSVVHNHCLDIHPSLSFGSTSRGTVQTYGRQQRPVSQGPY